MTPAERLLAHIVATLGVCVAALLLYALATLNYPAVGWLGTSAAIALLTYGVLRDESGRLDG